MNGRRNGGLRLVEVGLSWPPETFIALKLVRLAEQGLDVSVGSTAPREPERRLGRVRLERLPELDEGALRTLSGIATGYGSSLLARRAWRARRRMPLDLWRQYLHLTRLQPDVLHFEWLTVASRCLPLIEAWDGPVVVSCRGSDMPADGPVHHRPAPSALPAVFARADAVHCVAEASKRDALRFGLPPEKARLIRAAVDASFFRPPPAERPAPRGFSLVSVGWLRWLKGYEYAVQAVAELARQGIPVTLDVLGGDPPDDMSEQSQRARILHTAHDLGVSDRVRLHGDLAPAEVRRHLQRADAFLHASLSEGLPNVILEAMACAVPVVATDVGGTAEAIRDGVEGLLVPSRDPAAAAAALAVLWRDPHRRVRMGRAGRARVEAEFTLERQTRQWVELYEQVTAVA